MAYRRLLALVAILAVPYHVAAQSPDPELVRLEKQYEAAITAGDAAKLAGLFAEDGVFMPPNATGRKGSEGHSAVARGSIQGHDFQGDDNTHCIAGVG